MKKKSLIVGIIVIIIVIAISVGIVLTKSFVNHNEEKGIAEKLSNINAEELQNKLIEELKTTPLNITTSSISTTFGNNLTEIINEMYSDNTAVVYYYDLMLNNNKDEEDYIFAIYFDKNNKGTSLSIPCFKIESDSSGNFKNIISPITNGGSFGVGKNVWSAFTNVLKNEYNIDISNYSLGNGISNLVKEKKIKVMKYEADNLADTVSKEIIDKTDNIQYKFNKNDDYELNIQKFGIDTIKANK